MNQKICIVGAGTMGWSIAEIFAISGYNVILCDQKISIAQKGKENMICSMDKMVQKGKMSLEDFEKISNNVTPGNLSYAKHCSMAIEAIYEDVEAKKKVFLELENVLPQEAIIASNTSSISITELASCLKNPCRFVGMHFFNPATIMKLVEVVSGVHSSKKTIETVMDIAKQIGKVPVQIDDSPGFVVNRILIPMINEAVGIYAEGISSAEDIDTAMQLGANHPIGPLALGDLVGLDVCLAIMDVLYYETGDDKYRPHPLLRKMVRAKLLGRKTKQGFFSY